MNELVLLVDLENVQKFDVTQISGNSRVRVFVGAKQPKLPTSLVRMSDSLGERFTWVWIGGTGKNSLDFYIACYLGEALATQAQSEFVVLSGDTGFDPLLRYLNERGLRCRREAPAMAAKAAPKPVLDAYAQQVVEVLKRIEKNKRPRKRKTLTNHLVNHFQKRMSPEQVASAVAQLVKARLIGGTDSPLAYNF